MYFSFLVVVGKAMTIIVRYVPDLCLGVSHPKWRDIRAVGLELQKEI